MSVQLISSLSKIADAAPRVAQAVLDETADFILTLIRLYVPVDTGALLSSYDKQDAGALTILIGSALNYSLWVELGSSKMSAQPHLVPAFVQAESYFQQKLAERMAGII